MRKAFLQSEADYTFEDIIATYLIYIGEVLRTK